MEVQFGTLTTLIGLMDTDFFKSKPPCEKARGLRFSSIILPSVAIAVAFDRVHIFVDSFHRLNLGHFAELIEQSQ